MNVNELHGLMHYRNPRVSVIIPCYNAEKYIGECIRSVLMQDYEPIEIIVVDDASTDHSVGVIKKFVHEYPRIRAVFHDENKGECYTSNHGFELAQGEFLCRLASDDKYIYHRHIRRQVEEMMRHNLDWCYNSRNFTGRGNFMEPLEEMQTSWVPIPWQPAAYATRYLDNCFLQFPNYCYLVSVYRNPIVTSSVMLRRKAYLEYLKWGDGKARTICDSYLFSGIFLNRLKGRAIPEIGCLWRTNDNQQTGKPETDTAYAQRREEQYESIRNGNFSSLIKVVSEIAHRIVSQNKK